MERYEIEKINTMPDMYIVSDKQTETYCLFEKGKFNETQEFRNYTRRKYNAQELATICKEMGNWLRINHYDKLF